MNFAVRRIGVLLGLVLQAGSLLAAETTPVAAVAVATNDSAGVTQACRQISARLASVSQRQCERQALMASGAYSVKGFPLLVEEYPPLASRRPQGRVLVVGGIHGDELTSVSVVFKWMETLGRNHSGLFHWRVAPLMNPDGLLAAEAQRMNANGVDLNRNFPTPNWFDESQRHWVQQTGSNPRRYPGGTPMSEPETRWLVDEVERFRPDVIVAVHAPYGILDFDGHMPAPKQLGSLYLNLLGTYPGSLGNFGVQHNIPVITIELPSAGAMPSEREVGRIWGDLVRWLRRNVGSTAAQFDEGDQEAGPS